MNIQRLWVNEKIEDMEIWEALLKEAGIKKDKNIDIVIGLYDENLCIGTGAVKGNIIKCLVINEQYTGGAAVNALITHLESTVFEKYPSCFIYTKPKYLETFEFLGYKELGKIENQVVFMEKGLNDFESYLDDLLEEVNAQFSVAGIVMNANPFTYGHQYLVEEASKENERVYVFVVSEDKSLVPFSDRIDLVKAGTSHLSNVCVLQTGPYMVSQATFPSYFLSEEQDEIKIQASLDAKIFKEKIAPKLGISRRYVGEEPFSQTTFIYNQEMRKMFGNDLALIELERFTKFGKSISASYIRKLWRAKKYDEIKKYVPRSTYDYILSIERK